jgi:hypothetical protein
VNERVTISAMSLSVLLLAAAAAATARVPADAQPAPGRGAQVETARVSATILRPAVVVNGVLRSAGKAGSPHSQRQAGADRVNFLFE